MVPTQGKLTISWLIERMALGYVKNYRSFGITKVHTYTDITIRELNFFANLGEFLGYVSLLEYKKADLVWMDPESKTIALYLERETQDGRIVGEAIRKLESMVFNCTPDLIRVGVLGWSTVENLEHIKGASKRIPLSLFIAWVGPRQNDVEKIHIFVNDGIGSPRELEFRGQVEGDYWGIVNANQVSIGTPE